MIRDRLRRLKRRARRALYASASEALIGIDAALSGKTWEACVEDVLEERRARVLDEALDDFLEASRFTYLQAEDGTTWPLPERGRNTLS